MTPEITGSYSIRHDKVMRGSFEEIPNAGSPVYEEKKQANFVQNSSAEPSDL